ncbi:MAG: hypothetical protein LBH16_07060 [Treponema sp.]|jgi:hypothetical protein|nr:hypothetical protein [Treponema sp.]
MAERLIVSQEEASFVQEINDIESKPGFQRLCTVPLIMNSHYEALPTIVAPMTHRRKMRTVLMDPNIEGALSLYPYDGIGIYDRKRFMDMGGFDATLKNIHWQFMDFGFRSHLWGEEISLSLHLKLLCEGEIPAENYTIEKSYRRFYLKNLAPVFRGDHAHLPLYRFPSFLAKSGEDILSSWNEFSEGRNWVKKNRFRWKHSAHDITNKWGVSKVNAPDSQTPLQTHNSGNEQENSP